MKGDGEGRPELRPTIAVSACLIGEPVRYDGGDKRDRWIAECLAEHVDLVAICPEVAVGLGTPRPPIRLVRDARDTRAIGDGGIDPTDALRAYAAEQARALGQIDGYVFKSRSPSCGLSGLDVFDPSGRLIGHDGQGIYARSIRQRMGDLPVTDERHLADPSSRYGFIERARAHARWRFREKGR